ELRNGEGKTFVAVPVLVSAALKAQALADLAASVAAVPPFRACYAFTANDYLVRRDFVWLKGIYESLGISVSYLQREQTGHGIRRLSYQADLIYITGTEFGFDQLRNACRNFGTSPFDQSPYLVLVDEADQLLLDEAATPLILSGESNAASSTFIEKAWVQQTD